MPEENSFMRFHSGQYKFKVLFVICADFEAILQRLEEGTDSDLLSSYTRDINHHIPSRFCIYATFAYGEVEDLLRLYRGKDCIELFAITLKRKLRDFTICSLKNRWNP